MRDPKNRSVRKVQPANLMGGRPAEDLPNLMVSVNTEVLGAPARKHLELYLAVGDFLLFAGLCALMLGVMGLSGAQIHEGYFMLLNMTLAAGFAITFRYFDLTESRYSLGKSLLLSTSLWLMNGLALLTLDQLTAMAMAACGGVLGLNALLSGPIHYQLGRQYSQKNTQSIYYHFELGIKRAVDFTSSLLGMLFLLPLLMLVAMVVCMESKGSPIYTQTRIGHKEKKFLMYKFRSMITDAEKIELARLQVLYKRDNDPRITRFGGLIRKLSIDELPQLWNVVTGDMSLVGPRPPIEREYELMNWYHKRKFEAKPGLTGLWQVRGRVKNERGFNAVAAYDIAYLENWCLMEDIKILLATIPVVLFQKGAC